MTALLASLPTFGVCLCLAIALLIVLGVVTGENLLVFFITFPLLLAELLIRTVVRTNPHGGPIIKIVTGVLTILFALLTVPFLAAVLYGVYWLASQGIPSLTAKAPAVLGGARPPHIEHLLLVNNVLWFLAALPLVLLVWNIWGGFRGIRRMNGTDILSAYGVPLLRHGLAFLILPATQHYLLHYPNPNAYPGVIATVAAIAYVNLWLYTQGRRLLHGPRRLSIQYQPSVLEYKFFRALSVPHGFLFGYLLVRVFLSV